MRSKRQERLFRKSLRDKARAEEAEKDNLGWQCVVCKEVAKDFLDLHLQFLQGEDILFADSDLKYWIRCDNCSSSCHYSCVQNICKIYMSHEKFRKQGRWTCCGAPIY